MKLSYRGVAYESPTARRIIECETTAKYSGVTYTIQQFGQVLPAPAPNLKYRGASYRSRLSATHLKSVHSYLTNLADSDFSLEYSNRDHI